MLDANDRDKSPVLRGDRMTARQLPPGPCFLAYAHIRRVSAKYSPWCVRRCGFALVSYHKGGYERSAQAKPPPHCPDGTTEHMFGISLTKLLVLLALATVVWYGFRRFDIERTKRGQPSILKRKNRGSDRPIPESDAKTDSKTRREPEGEPEPSSGLEVVPCKVCGVYFAQDDPGSHRRCERKDCPRGL